MYGRRPGRGQYLPNILLESSLCKQRAGSNENRSGGFQDSTSGLI